MEGDPLLQLTAPLLDWYRANGRDLPWRRTRDPYSIWVSEIMLQQTRVTAALPYYLRFLQTFPTVEALAAAEEETLFKLWEGLGYYSRARNLQKTARIVTERYGGRFPESYGELTALPGIGDYTAGAILAAAFGRRAPAVDGNVLRVAARLWDDPRDIQNAAVKKEIRRRVEEAMPEEPEAIRNYNQALMDLGATVCLPNGAPLCEACPARTFCRGRARGTAQSLPVRAPKKDRRAEERTVFLLRREGKIALRKRPDEGLLAGLWEFPNVFGSHSEEEAASVLADWSLIPAEWGKKLTAKHIFSHVEWHMIGYSLKVTGEGLGDFFWADRAALERCAVPSAFARYRTEAKKLLEEAEADAL